MNIGSLNTGLAFKQVQWANCSDSPEIDKVMENFNKSPKPKMKFIGTKDGEEILGFLNGKDARQLDEAHKKVSLAKQAACQAQIDLTNAKGNYEDTSNKIFTPHGIIVKVDRNSL
jgi:hypothetical protein